VVPRKVEVPAPSVAGCVRWDRQSLAGFERFIILGNGKAEATPEVFGVEVAVEFTGGVGGEANGVFIGKCDSGTRFGIWTRMESPRPR